MEKKHEGIEEKENEVKDITGIVDEEEETEEEEKIKEKKETDSDDKDKTKEEIQEEEPKSSEKDTKKLIILILSVIVIFVITFIISFYIYKNYSTPEYPEYEYNGFKFVKIAGLWHTQWQQDDKLFNVHLRYGPKESADIPHYAEDSSFNPTGTIYITFDPGEGKRYVALAGTEISLSLANTFNITPIAACTTHHEDCEERPIITCDNTDDAVIYIKESLQEASITTKENCLIIQGQGEDLVRAADKVLWIWYGIIR